MSSTVALAIQSAPTTIPVATFPQFPQLPPELRIMIWKLALYRKPRIIVASKMSRGDFEKEPEEIHNSTFATRNGPVLDTVDTSNRIFAVDPQGQISPVGCSWDVGLNDHTVPTSLLHTCGESRQQALKIYEISFKGLESFLPGSSSPKYIYFDWSRDQLLVDDARSWKSFFGRDSSVPNDEPRAVSIWLSKIEHLKLSCGFLHCMDLYEYKLTELAALKTLSILGHPCPTHLFLNTPCGRVARCKAKFITCLESHWRLELGQEKTNSLPVVIFAPWTEFHEDIVRNEVRVTINKFPVEVKG
jgi:hypothetical protein